MTDDDQTSDKQIDSPCLGVCVIDARIDACFGCFRTIAEIVAWPEANLEERRRILDAMAERRRDAGVPEPPAPNVTP